MQPDHSILWDLIQRIQVFIPYVVRQETSLAPIPIMSEDSWGEPMLQTKAFWFCLSHCVYPILCVFCLLWDVSFSCTSLQSLCCQKSWLTCVRSYKRLGSMKPCTPDVTEFHILLFSKAFGHSCHWAGAFSWGGESRALFLPTSRSVLFLWLGMLPTPTNLCSFLMQNSFALFVLFLPLPNCAPRTFFTFKMAHQDSVFPLRLFSKRNSAASY